MWLKGCTINESWCELQNFGIKALKKVRWLQVVPGPWRVEMQDFRGVTSLAISRRRIRPWEG